MTDREIGLSFLLNNKISKNNDSGLIELDKKVDKILIKNDKSMIKEVVSPQVDPDNYEEVLQLMEYLKNTNS